MAPTCFGPFGPSSGCRHRNLAKVIVSLKYQLKHIVKIVVVQWQWEFQFLVCALGAVRKVPMYAPWRWSKGTETFRSHRYLNTNCSNLCFNKQCICRQNNFILIKMQGKTTTELLIDFLKCVTASSFRFIYKKSQINFHSTGSFLGYTICDFSTVELT
jgi:hypothetical protein